jgi:hypothetical protein
MRICAGLRGRDASACLRGVPSQALAGEPGRQLRLIRACSRQLRLIRACSRITVAARSECYAWLGRTLAVVTNGAFSERGCMKLTGSARSACVAGAKRLDAALVTFS